MKVPFFWLKEYISFSLNVEEVAHILTLLGLEVEGIDSPTYTFSDVVVGEILTSAKHPHADRLQVATVTDGQETFQIVCGAPNCRAGLKTAFAKIGAKLQDPSGKNFTIKKSKLREVESFGMLCSTEELGLSQAEGILELPSDAPVGAPLASILSEPILEISITPNLGHCLCMLGIARELSAYMKIPIRIPKGHVQENPETTINSVLEVDLEAPNACTRYACRYLSNIEVGPSPSWLKKKLEAAGMKSINNIVDIGNFVMLEMGQPLHMFDAAKIHGKKLIISQAVHEGEFTILDGSTCKYPTSALLINDTQGPLALAGIMGGLNSGITNTTKEIVIEAAAFNPSTIRMASKQTGLRSESSYRFERGIDRGGVVHALERAVELVCEIAGGIAAKGLIDRCPKSIHPTMIPCRIARVNSLLGLNLSQNEIRELFIRLGMTIDVENSEVLAVTIPTYRNDLRTEVDLIEEVARLYGYNNIPKPTVRHISATFPDAPLYTFEMSFRKILLREGLQECLTCDLISPSQAALTEKQGMDPGALIHVLQPSSAEQSILRPSLLPGLLQVVKHNQDQGISDIAAYEVGKIHFQEIEKTDHPLFWSQLSSLQKKTRTTNTSLNKFHEQLMAAIILTGNDVPHHFDSAPSTWDFFDLKGIVENLCEHQHLPELKFLPCHHAIFHPFRQALVSVNGETVGILGELHPEILRSHGIKQNVLFAEINLSDLHPMKKHLLQIKELPSFPGTERDWTITISDRMPIATLVEAIKSSASPLLCHFLLLGIYKGEQLGPDRKNATIRFFYRDPQQTISLETVEKEHAQVMQRVAQKIHDHL